MTATIHYTQKVIVWFALIFEGEAAIWHVVQILKPFEVGDGHTTSVDIQIRNHENVAFEQNFVSSRGCRTVGGFSDDLRM